MRKALFATTTLAVWTALSATSLPAFALGKLATINVIDRSTGQSLPVHYFRGEYWVAGTPGNKYAIEINNKQAARVLAVTSVDGVNVVTGQTASLVQSGYVFSAWQNYEITGWRKSDSAVAAFEFTASPNSYAEQTGRPRDVGVIGVAIFKEKVIELSRDHSYSSSKHSSSHRPSAQSSAAEQSAASATPAPAPQSARASASTGAPDAGSAKESKSAGARAEAAPDQSQEKSANRSSSLAGAASPPAAKLGTGHGERENSQVSRTAFERASDQPAEIIRIRYDNYSNLVAMGVIQPNRSSPRRPDPFPDSQAGYVPDPRR
jgi:hypothetical protein